MGPRWRMMLLSRRFLAKEDCQTALCSCRTKPRKQDCLAMYMKKDRHDISADFRQVVEVAQERAVEIGPRGPQCHFPRTFALETAAHLLCIFRQQVQFVYSAPRFSPSSHLQTRPPEYLDRPRPSPLENLDVRIALSSIYQGAIPRGLCRSTAHSRLACRLLLLCRFGFVV